MTPSAPLPVPGHGSTRTGALPDAGASAGPAVGTGGSAGGCDGGAGGSASVTEGHAGSAGRPDGGGQHGEAAPQDWAAARRQAAAERERLLAARQDAEHARAGRIVSLFLTVAHAEGLAPQPLRVQGYGSGSARTGLTGWYLRGDRTVAIDTDGRFYTLTAPLSWIDRVRGYQPTPEPVPLVIGEGGRDGDVIDLRAALERLLPGWEERSPEPLP